MASNRTTFLKLTAAQQAVITTCFLGISISEHDCQRLCFRQVIRDTIHNATGYDPDFIEWLESKGILYSVDASDYNNACRQLAKQIQDKLSVKVILL